MIPVSSRLWNPRGRTSYHSIDDGMCCLDRTGRWEANASHRIKINMIKAIKDSIDPMDEITFHFINASG
jgi:hypothetical protein